ncbi:MAG: response regulator transcription factor [Acidimicrobiia bacterium]|nr:response regulator transcription factor [Acidimicrobiia bacterium]
MNGSPRVLVVEDEPSFVEALSAGLRREGFALDIARDGREALDRFKACEPDLVLLDVMLPRLSGLDVCRELRAISNVPIVMVSAKGEEIDTVVGLEVGADDYVPKPYRFRELVARMRAALRRAQLQAEQSGLTEADSGRPLEIGDVSIDPRGHEVWVRGETVRLPLKEFDLLRTLMANAGRVVSRDDLIDEVWGADYVGDTKTLDAHIRRLRRKIEVEPSNPRHIVTVRGVGYKYSEPAASPGGNGDT